MSLLGDYWAGVLSRLQAEVQQMNQLIAHEATKGVENELAIARVLEGLIPSRFGVGSGLLIDSTGRASRQMDIVVFEKGDEATLLAQTNQVIFPIETVKLCIEVKTTLSKAEVDDARKKSASIKSLQSARALPAFGLFAYSSSVSPSTIADHLSVETTDAGSRPAKSLVMDSGFVAGLDSSGEWRQGIAARRDAEGGTDVPEADEVRFAIRDGRSHPVVQVDRSRAVIGEPARALLLFAEWLLQELDCADVISRYIPDELRELDSV